MKFFSKPSADFLIVGLGNPGGKYDHTRHNAGFMAIDEIAAEAGVRIIKSKFSSLYQTAVFGGVKVVLLKPQTYMNRSGEAVKAAMNYFKLSPEKTLVIYDEAAFDLGQLRLRREGTHGGHNGMRDIIDCAGSTAFPRIRIGIGKKPRQEMDLADWVLSVFSSDELKQIKEAAKRASGAAKLIVGGKMEEAMSRYNGL